MNIKTTFLVALCSLLLLGNASVIGQTTVSGNVIDASINEPLIGATVIIKGTSIGSITNYNGDFNFNTSQDTGTLVVSFIGYLPKEVPFSGQQALKIALSPDTEELDEVVVIGYGTQKKSHLTGSVAKLDTEGLDQLPVPRADQVLQGRVAGVQVQNVSSMVGETPNISIRGTGSISANGQPLVIVDGFPVSDGLSVVDVSDIESMEVLKDAASAAIYGSRAANGVIIVTTKSGSTDKPRYNFKVSHGIKDVYELHPMMTTEEYINLEIEEGILKGRSQLTDQYFAMYVLGQNTEVNWQEEALRLADVTNAQFSVSGGKKGVKYYMSGSYLNDEGIMYKNSYDRINVRSKVEAELSNRVTVGFNMAPTFTTRTRPTNNFTDFLRTPSFLPVYHDSVTSDITGMPVGDPARGNDFSNRTYVGVDPISGLERVSVASPFTTSNNNPRWVMDNQFYSQNDYRMQGSGFLQIEIIDGLQFKTNNGFNVVYSDIQEYSNRDAKVMGDEAIGEYRNKLFTDVLSENTFMYNKTIGLHSINALLGASVQQRTYRTAEMVGTEFPTDYIHDINAAGSITQVDEDGDIITGTWTEEEALASVYSRLSYAYDNKYLLSASFRADGSSKFGSENRWGYFPSVSLGWNVHQEDFLKDNVALISQLKLRASYGITGTDDILNYANTNTLQSNFYILGAGNGSLVPGLSNTKDVLGNKTLQWEQTNEYNYGLDFGMFEGRISLGVDYYYSITRSLLYERSLNSVSGFTQVWSNKGKVRNNGVEILLNTVNIAGNNFKWESGFNFSLNRNRVLDLAGPEFLINSGERGEEYITQVGDPIVQFHGYQVIGVWNSQEEIDANPSNPADVPGGLRVADLNGDGEITAEDYTVIGNPLPDFNFGISNNLSYKDFMLSFLVQGVIGGDVVNGDFYYNETKRYNKNFNSNRWVNEENPGDGMTPYFNYGINQMLTSNAIDDASYIALRDLTLTYTLPKNLSERIKVSGLRVYLSGSNLLYWWSDGYRGINPEARKTDSQYASPLVDGYQRGAFPVQRIYSAGIEFNF